MASEHRKRSAVQAPAAAWRRAPMRVQCGTLYLGLDAAPRAAASGLIHRQSSALTTRRFGGTKCQQDETLCLMQGRRRSRHALSAAPLEHERSTQNHLDEDICGRSIGMLVLLPPAHITRGFSCIHAYALCGLITGVDGVDNERHQQRDARDNGHDIERHRMEARSLDRARHHHLMS